jgi:transposase InsO family protein
VKNKLSTKIKALRTDRGCEYLFEQFKKIYDEKGIARQLTIPYTPQQNGVAERRNRTLFDMVRLMMTQANLPISFWGDTLLTAVYILNRVPSKSVSSTPYELWNGVKPNLSYFYPWGVQLIFTILLMNMGNLVLGGRNVSLYDILNIPKDLYLLVKKLMEE